MNLEKRKKEIEDRLVEIRGLSEAETNVDTLAEFETEVDKLQEERSAIEKKLNIAGKSEVRIMQVETNSAKMQDLEKRGNDLRENRVIQISADEILVPNHVSSTINPLGYSTVSTIADKVDVINLNGGETYKKSFVTGYGIAGNTGEAEEYKQAEPKFGYATIQKVKLTAYTEITEELEKLPSLPYQAEVVKNINIALRKKIVQQIIRGAGTTNTFTGIFCDTVEAIDSNTDLSISTIDENTLNKIVFAYGGDEEVESGACLILNKSDLMAFSNLRTAEGRKVHTIDYKNKTIDGIDYQIVSFCNSVVDSSTADGAYCMAYGSLKNYQVPIFSPIEIGKSTDYKFKDGIICYKASVFTGGNTVSFNGFLRIKKGSATTSTASNTTTSTSTSTK